MGNALPTTCRRAGSPLSSGLDSGVDRYRVGAGFAGEHQAIRLPDTDQAKSEGSGLCKIVVLRASDEVQGNVLLLIDGRDFKTSHHLGLSLAHFGRLSCQYFSHSCVIRGDFIES